MCSTLLGHLLVIRILFQLFFSSSGLILFAKHLYSTRWIKIRIPRINMYNDFSPSFSLPFAPEKLTVFRGSRIINQEWP